MGEKFECPKSPDSLRSAAGLVAGGLERLRATQESRRHKQLADHWQLLSARSGRSEGSIGHSLLTELSLANKGDGLEVTRLSRSDDGMSSFYTNLSRFVISLVDKDALTRYVAATIAQHYDKPESNWRYWADKVTVVDTQPVQTWLIAETDRFVRAAINGKYEFAEKPTQADLFAMGVHEQLLQPERVNGFVPEKLDEHTTVYLWRPQATPPPAPAA